jgi:hypothetical protein
MMVLTGKTQKDQKTIKHLIDQDQEGIAAHHKVVQDQDETGIEIGLFSFSLLSFSLFSFENLNFSLSFCLLSVVFSSLGLRSLSFGTSLNQ